MRVFNSLSVFALFAVAFLVWCCISASAYALTDDEPIFRIPPMDPSYEPLFIDLQPMPTDENGQVIIEFVLPPGIYPPTFIYPSNFRNSSSIDSELPPLDFSDFINSHGIDSYSTKGSAAVVPEPSTLLLLALGVAMLRRRSD